MQHLCHRNSFNVNKCKKQVFHPTSFKNFIWLKFICVFNNTVFFNAFRRL